VEFWRILLRHPELLTWETFWSDSMREMQREFYAQAKSIKPEIQVGFHIWHNIAFNPMYRAEQDYASYTEYSDFLKPVLYDNPAAERMTSYVYSVTQNIYGDLDPSKCSISNTASWATKARKPTTRSSANPSRRTRPNFASCRSTARHAGRSSGSPANTSTGETKRAVDAVAGSKTQVCPGIGIDVAVKNSTPESVRDAVYAVFKAGGRGPDTVDEPCGDAARNLSAAGAALREFKLA